MAAEKMDIREETAKAIDETSLNSFVSSYLITPMGYSSYINSEEYVQPLSEQMYELQTEIIKKLAERGPNVLQKDTMCLRRRLSTALNEWTENGNTITKPIRGRNGEASVLMRYC